MASAIVQGTKIRFLQLGEWHTAPPLVLIHGLATSSGFWFRAVEQLAARHPVLIYDLRGHGRSAMPEIGYTPEVMAGDLLGLLDHLGISRCHAAAHSFGGSILLHAALRAPDRFATLTLADARLRCFQPLLTPRAWHNWEERLANLATIGIHLEPDQQEAGIVLLTALARHVVAHPDDTGNGPRWLLEFMGQRQNRTMAMRWLQLMETPGVFDALQEESALVPESLRDLPHPLLALYGDDSPIRPSGEALKHLRPGTDLGLILEAGHFFPAFKPAEFVQPLLAHLNAHADR